MRTKSKYGKRSEVMAQIGAEMIRTYRAEGLSFARIAREMNKLKVKTPYGALWYAASVRRTLLSNGGEVLAEMPRPGRKAAK